MVHWFDYNYRKYPLKFKSAGIFAKMAIEVLEDTVSVVCGHWSVAQLKDHVTKCSRRQYIAQYF